jgi:hypothetical protein
MAFKDFLQKSKKAIKDVSEKIDKKGINLTNAGKITGSIEKAIADKVADAAKGISPELSRHIVDVGNGAKNSMTELGSISDKVVRGTGKIFIGEDGKEREEGVSEIAAAGKNVGMGIYKGVVSLGRDAKGMISGLYNRDPEKVKQYAIKLVKTGAIAAVTLSPLEIAGVTALGIDALDGVDGVDVSDVGDNYDFDSTFQIRIPEDMYLESDNVHQGLLLGKLQESVDKGDHFDFSTNQLAQISNGQIPDGYVCHHHQSPGVLQLVSEETHQAHHHVGGRQLWGGGEQYRS